MFHLPSKTQAMFCKICKDLENSLEVDTDLVSQRSIWFCMFAYVEDQLSLPLELHLVL